MTVSDEMIEEICADFAKLSNSQRSGILSKPMYPIAPRPPLTPSDNDDAKDKRREKRERRWQKMLRLQEDDATISHEARISSAMGVVRVSAAKHATKGGKGDEGVL
jgi:hypothetical protein